MPVYRIPEEEFVFPRPELAEENGLLGVGGDLHPERLLLAYATGIFPWYSEGQPILWFSPDPRCVLDPTELHIGRSLRKVLKKRTFRVTLDTAFSSVIDACKETPRPGQEGTWITAEMRAAYCHLHDLGHAHSVEVWSDDELVGGLYGVSLGHLFAGESMFSRESDASKTGLVWLVRQLQQWGFGLIDAQVTTDTLTRMGAVERSREAYLASIAELVAEPGRVGTWSFDEGFHPLLD
jgi:leucyl/phenylalanyl-tRNA---protein transferase